MVTLPNLTKHDANLVEVDQRRKLYLTEVDQKVFHIPCMTTFGERLRHWADTKFRTYGECAEAVGVSQGMLSKYMLGKQEPTLESLMKFAKAGVSVDWLLTGTGPMDVIEVVTKEQILEEDDRRQELEGDPIGYVEALIRQNMSNEELILELLNGIRETTPA
jgi:transcriptional regulator with XRE-family HTH domain